jgi:hypothetical protein
MDAPDRQLDPLRFESLLPSQDVMIDTINQGAVEIEQK